MLYLEDGVEMIEHVPQDIRDRLTEMRELDLHVQNTVDSICTRTAEFFGSMKKAKVEDPEGEYAAICAEYTEVCSNNGDKLNIATQMEEMMQRHMRKLDVELNKFKWELEADHPGITEVLEERSLQLDEAAQPQAPPSLSRTASKSNRKSAASAMDGSLSLPISAPPHVRGSMQAETAFFPSTSGLPGLASPPNTVGHPSSMPGVFSPEHGPYADATLGYTPTGGRGAGQVNGRHMPPAPASPFSNGKNRRATPSSSSAGMTGLGALSASTPKTASKLDSAGLALDAASAGAHLKKHKSRKRPKPHSLSGSMAVLDVGGGTLPHPPAALGLPMDTAGQSHTPIHQQQQMAAASATSAEWRAMEPSLEPGEAEKLYCVCNQVSYGEMVACDNPSCAVEWFHYPCVNLTAEPVGKWYCPKCAPLMNSATKRKKHHHRTNTTS